MIQKIVESLDRSISQYAVFDCDETLINGDIEYAVLKYLFTTGDRFKISEQELESILKDFNIKYSDFRDTELGEEFSKICSRAYNYSGGISITSKVLKNYTKKEITELAKLAFDRYITKKESMFNLIQYLKNNDIEIYICSASEHTLVSYVASLFGLTEDKVLAVKLEFINDKNTGKEIVNTRGINKVKAIKELGYDNDPFLIAGDSDGDYYMFTRFNILHGMVINSKENTKVNELIDNFVYFDYKL